MKYIFEDANDQHARKVIAYGDESGNLYQDSSFEKPFSADEIKNAFFKGMLLIDVPSDGTYAPVSCDADGTVVTVHAGDESAVVLREWSAYTEEE